VVSFLSNPNLWVFYEFNPKILLWVNVIVIRLVNVINGLVFNVMGICLGCDF
jgi:hypothetical protein